MLLQMENTDQQGVKKLLLFAQQNNISLSVIDDVDNNFLLPGKPLTPEKLIQLILKSRESGIVGMKDAHGLIRNSYNAG